jgi:plastocyanin
MLSRAIYTATFAVALIASIQGAEIAGRVVVKRKLTKRNVTAASCVYQRGAAVELGADLYDDPLAYERAQVVVYLEDELPPAPVSAVLEQKNRRFVPEILVVPVGSTVSFPNRDLIFHNVFSLSKAKSFDLGTYPKDQTRTSTFSKPGVVYVNCHLHPNMYVNCHLHPNMGAVIVVTPNKWATRVDSSGTFHLSNIPGGEHTVVAWHKSAGPVRQKIHLQGNETARLEFLVPLDEDGKPASVARR